MLYNREEFPHYVRTAGKITILTALTGLLVFMVAFMFDLGTQEFNRVSAQSATTTLTVLNTPPYFALNAFETPASATNTPTNSGDAITWQALGVDTNSAPYFLLICSTNATPTANAASSSNSLGTAPPTCGGGIQWGVSASTTSGEIATVSTTTTELAPFAESNDWYAWVCDDDPFNPRCNTVAVQGPTSTPSGTSSSPFHVNKRPTFFSLSNNGPVDPGGTLQFDTISDDQDVVGGEDEIFLVICQSDSNYNSNTNTCSDFIASTTIGALSNVQATYTLASIVRDDTYPAFGFLFDEHGHEATSSPLQANFVVNNVAPTVLGGDIVLNGGLDLILTQPATQTPGFTLDFTLRDSNSCVNIASTSEIVDFKVALYRSDFHSTSTCDASADAYDPNNCYTSGVGSTTWALSCTATSTCAGPTQDFVDYACTFPLWFLADPTDSGPNTPTAFADDFWTVAIAGVDDNNASGSLATTTDEVDLRSFSAIDILAANIAYPGIEPGDDSGSTNATSTALNVGNTGLDQLVAGTSMCTTFSATTTCPVSATSTIPVDQQQFASTTFTYGAAFAVTLQTSTSSSELELDIPKTTSTVSSNWEQGTTYWGIAVPISITLAGNYTGLNTFYARTAEAIDW